PAVLAHELLLLLDVGLPEEAGDLVEAGPDPAEQILDAGGRVGHAEGRLDPVADLVGVVEHPRLDLLLEPPDLGRPEATRIALVCLHPRSSIPSWRWTWSPQVQWAPWASTWTSWAALPSARRRR